MIIRKEKQKQKKKKKKKKKKKHKKKQQKNIKSLETGASLLFILLYLKV